MGQAGDAAATLALWQAAGVEKTVVKLGRDGCLLPDGTLAAPPAIVAVTDSSGAGDAFNAGYLASRLDGGDVAEAAARGQRLAVWRSSGTARSRPATPPRPM
jgi:2-dehydro-3-deoxygluconokinase